MTGIRRLAEIFLVFGTILLLSDCKNRDISAVKVIGSNKMASGGFLAGEGTLTVTADVAPDCRYNSGSHGRLLPTFRLERGHLVSATDDNVPENYPQGYLDCLGINITLEDDKENIIVRRSHRQLTLLAHNFCSPRLASVDLQHCLEGDAKNSVDLLIYFAMTGFNSKTYRKISARITGQKLKKNGI